MNDQTQCYMIKSIDNAFDHMALCFAFLTEELIMPLTIWNCVCLTKGRVISAKTGLFFQEITFITEFPGSNVLLPTFLTGSKRDFQVANLLLATVNFKP